MKIVETTFEKLPRERLVIGFEGENLRATVRIDCASVFAEYPNATPTLIVKPLFADAYPVVVDRNGTDVDWLITSEILSFTGDGEIQLVFYKDEVICKSAVSKIRVCRSLQVTGEMPDPVVQWIENANRKLAEVDAQIVELEGMVDTATDAATRAEQSASTASTKAEQAAGSAATASAKAAEAQASANTATAKASESALSATQARNSAMSAANSESGATAKAAEAAQSAQTAAQKAEQITEAAQIATGKAGEASASATAAHASATDAASSATAAQAAQTAAEASETAASTSATQAAQSAQGASSDAQTATQKAAEASQSASNAAASEQTATQKAGEAEASAQTAQEAKTAVEQTVEQLADSLEQIEQNTQDIAELDERKANIDGYYPDMTVGNAEQLNSSKYVENSEPYTFRTSGGSSDIGNREYLDAVVGGTVAWNQQIPATARPSGSNNGITFTNNEDGSWNVSGTATENASRIAFTASETIMGHVIYFCGCPTGGGLGAYRLYINGLSGYIDYGNGVIAKPTGLAYPHLTMFVYSGVTVNNVWKPQIFDLTQMFGSTVADYIYNLETATAGAGVALFRSWFPKGYYEYNAGELLSVEGLQSHDMVGFNQWDEEWEVGAYNGSNGNKVASNDRIRSKNKIAVVPNTYYFVKAPYNLQLYEYGADGAFLRQRWSGTSNARALISSDAHYITFNGAANSGTTYKHDICISLAHNGSRNGEYEPYEKHSYPLDSTVILRGIPKVGANGVYWDGDRYLPDGTVERRYKEILIDESHRWYKDTDQQGYSRYYFEDDTIKRYLGYSGLIPNSKGYENANGYAFAYATNDVAVSLYNIGGGTNAGKNWFYIGFKPSMGINTVDALKTWLASNNFTVVVELATPTIETAQPYHSTQWVSDWGTEEFVSTSIVPVGSETRYPANLRDKLQHLPDAASGNGSYLITQTDGQMVLTPFPAPPSTAGNYVLKATVVNGVATYTWEVAT